MRWNITVSLLAGMLFVAIFGSQGSIAAELTRPLDGGVFVVETGEKGEEASGRDVLLFLKGRFISTFCHKYHGFRQGAYMVRPMEGGIFFSADCLSEKEGVMHWEGTVRGGKIEVRYVWRRPSRWYRPWVSVAEGWARSLTHWDRPDPATAGEAAEPSRQLDGRVFYAQAGMQGTSSDHEDYLIFWDGKFISSSCAEDSFRISAYSVTEQNDGLHFHAETVSTKYGMMMWDGVISGNRILANSRWMHTRWLWKIDRNYRYQGVMLN